MSSILQDVDQDVLPLDQLESIAAGQFAGDHMTGFLPALLGYVNSRPSST